MLHSRCTFKKTTATLARISGIKKPALTDLIVVTVFQVPPDFRLWRIFSVTSVHHWRKLRASGFSDPYRQKLPAWYTIPVNQPYSGFAVKSLVLFYDTINYYACYRANSLQTLLGKAYSRAWCLLRGLSMKRKQSPVESFSQPFRRSQKRPCYSAIYPSGTKVMPNQLHSMDERRSIQSRSTYPVTPSSP